MAPLQDTPSVKYTYGACVTVENTVVPVMSANITSTKVASDTSFNITCFHMDIPIADYLIAIAIGDITTTSLGGRCEVLAEPGQIDSVI